jgi:hypothetical protein
LALAAPDFESSKSPGCENLTSCGTRWLAAQSRMHRCRCRPPARSSGMVANVFCQFLWPERIPLVCRPRHSELTPSDTAKGIVGGEGRFWAVCRPYGSNRQKRCPKSSATSIGLRAHTLATVAERIAHSHPAFTVAGATRVRRHCGTWGDRDAAVFFCSALSAHIRRPIPHRPSQFNRPSPFPPLIFPGHCFGLIPASCSFPPSAFPVPPSTPWAPSQNAAARFGSSSLSLLGTLENGAEKGKKKMSYLYVKWNRSGLQFAR